MKSGRKLCEVGFRVAAQMWCGLNDGWLGMEGAEVELGCGVGRWKR